MSTIKSEGKILIASSNVTGKLFAKTAIYIHTHDTTGAVGVMLNVPMDYDMAVSWSNEIDWQFPNSVYHGGPLDRQLGYIIHSSDYAQETSVPLNDAISYTGGRAVVTDINRGVGPHKFQLLTGYCQWQPNQLETEIENNMWSVVDFDINYLFQDLDRENGWEYAIALAAENKTATLLDTIDTL
jgi:putative transcriptional regulator